jgi:site-specific DNA recombinase
MEVIMGNRKLRAAIYCRTSSDESKYSLENQEKSIKRIIENKENIELYRVYKDYGFSGATSKRPDYEKLMEDIEMKRIDIVYTYKLSRIARRAKLIRGFLDLLNKNNVELCVTEDNINGTNGFTNKLMLAILCEFVEEEFRNIKLFTLKNRRERMKKGKSPGGPVPYGYKRAIIKDDSGKEDTGYEIVESEAKIVREIFNKVANKVPIKNIVNDLEDRNITNKEGNKISEKFIKDMIRRETYHGWILFGDPKRHKNSENTEDPIYEKGIHKSIVSDALFKKANNILDSYKGKKVNRTKDTTKFLFSGQLECWHCGGKMYNKPNGDYRYYHCSNSRNKNGCSERMINADLVEETLIMVVVEQILKNEVFKENIKLLGSKLKDRNDLISNKNLIKKNEIKLTDIDKKLERLQDGYYKKNSMSEEKFLELETSLLNDKNKIKEDIEFLKNDEQIGIEKVDVYFSDYDLADYTLDDVKLMLKDPEQRKSWYKLVENYISIASFNKETKTLGFAGTQLLGMLLSKGADIEPGDIPTHIKFNILDNL